jgi:nitroreductase
MPIDLTNADALLTTTRGVRRRIDFDRPVERSVIEDCVEVAMQAPYGLDWFTHFIAVTDPELRKRIGEIYDSVSAPYIDQLKADEMAKAEDDEAKAKVSKEMTLHRWYNTNMYRVPVLMVIAMEVEVNELNTSELAGVYGSCLPAAWSFMLALRARGLGTCWTTLHIYKQSEVDNILGVPDGMTHVALLPIGYYRGTDFKRAGRPIAKNWLHWNRYCAT